MFAVLNLPITLLRLVLYALLALADVLHGRSRVRAKKTIRISASREAVWRFLTADRVVFDGPPSRVFESEALPGDANLRLTRFLFNGQECVRFVTRRLKRDEIAGTDISQQVAHELTWPPEFASDCLTELNLVAIPRGTALSMSNELTVRSFRDRIDRRVDLAHFLAQVKQQCEKEAGTQSRLPALANHGFVVSFVALLSFWYLVGLKDALLLAAIVVIHEAGHALAMRMVGVEVQGIYLVPFFGGAAVPKSAYPSEGALGFVALMGPGFSLIPTLALVAMFWLSGDERLLKVTSMFAFINGVNLLPIYPLDGGLILNALLGSLNRRLALVVGWIGVLTGLGVALLLKSWLIGIPFLLFALQRYLTRGRTPELRRLSFAGAVALVLSLVATFALYVLAFGYAESMASD